MSYFNDLFITGITHIFSMNYEKKTSANMKDRENFGICFVKNGTVSYSYNGKIYVCNENQAMVIPKGFSYSWECTAECTVFIINFFTTDDFKLKGFTEIPIKNPEKYWNIFLLLKKSYSSNNFYGNPKYLSLIYKIIENLDAEAQISVSAQLNGIIEFINEKYSDCKIDNRILARRQNLSVSHFRSLFKKSYNVSPMNYVQTLRIEKAKHLLLYSNFSVGEISEKCGFSNLYSFSRAFKRCVGLSPRDFTKQGKTYLI